MPKSEFFQIKEMKPSRISKNGPCGNGLSGYSDKLKDISSLANFTEREDVVIVNKVMKLSHKYLMVMVNLHVPFTSNTVNILISSWRT